MTIFNDFSRLTFSKILGYSESYRSFCLITNKFHIEISMDPCDESDDFRSGVDTPDNLSSFFGTSILRIDGFQDLRQEDGRICRSLLITTTQGPLSITVFNELDGICRYNVNACVTAANANVLPLISNFSENTVV